LLEIKIDRDTSVTQLRPLLEQADASPYDLTRVAEEKCRGDGHAGPSTLLVAYEKTTPIGLAVASANAVRLLVVDKRHRRKGVATALLREAEQIVVANGHRRAVLAAEPGNYLTPGIWDEARTAIEFAEASGYVTHEEATNLEVPLRDSPYLDLPSTRAIRAKLSDRERILDFIGSEFGKIWRFESQRAFLNDSPTIFFAEDQRGEVCGFSAHEANNRGLGWYGPAGVRQSQRRSGLGRDLLLASLHDLRERGHSSAIIPWAAALGFYEKVSGAKPLHRFRRYMKEM